MSWKTDIRECHGQKGVRGCHEKKVSGNVMRKGCQGMPWEKGVRECHGKRFLVNVMGKGSQ